MDEPAPVSPDPACKPNEVEEQPKGEAEVEDATPGNCVRHFPNLALEAHAIDKLGSVKPRDFEIDGRPHRDVFDGLLLH